MLFCFLLCIGYWTYLVFTSQMVIVHDSLTYQALGAMLHEQGWLEYFRTGPHREPLYPFVVSVAMALADFFSSQYSFILKILQCCILFVSQVLVLKLMDHLRVSKTVKCAMILYMGFSPAVVNSAFSLYSEIVAMPFVVLAVLSGMRSWDVVLKGQIKGIFVMAILTALTFLFASFSKAVFLYAFVVYILFFMCVLYLPNQNRNKTMFKYGACYLLTALIVFNGFTTGYKMLNKMHNGQFRFTNRSVMIFFASAYKRAEPLTRRSVMANLAAVPGSGVCKMFFSKEECRECEWYGTEKYMTKFRDDLLKGIPPDRRDARSLELAFEQIWQHPVNFSFFFAVESFKMFFWESTQIGFVDYPGWLNRLFVTTWFKNALRLIISFITIVSFVYLYFKIWRQRKHLIESTSTGRQTQGAFFMGVIMLGFIGVYALCYVLTRYALPIVPLYIAAIAFFFDNFFKQRSS